MNSKEIIRQITQILRERKDIAFAYVFGSVLTSYYQLGKSDVDLGIYFEDEKKPEQVLELADQISAKLEGHPEVDIVDMRNANLIINHQIFENGAVVLENDPDKHTRFYITQLSMYIDFKMNRADMEAALINPDDA